jgi:thiol-disulfide isomerase/thioredoxin
MNMKQTIITILLALAAMTGQAKTFKTIKNPETMACVNVNPGELKAREIIFRDTATTVHFTMEKEKGQSFRFAKESYLMDEDGNRYPLRSAEGIDLDSWVQSPESGVTDFTMHFEPMPKNTQVFDYIEGDNTRAYMLLGIHDKKYIIKYPTIQELSDANPWTVPQDWFKTDTITIKGRIEGFDAERLGFDLLCYYNHDEFEKGDAAQVMDIAPDGTFCKKFKASYPIRDLFWTTEAKTQFNYIPFFARPGETIDITVRIHEDGWYDYTFNSGSSHDVERWLRFSDEYIAVFRPLYSFKGRLEEGNKLAESIFQEALYRLRTESRRYKYTPIEMQLALADLQANFVENYLSYVDNYAQTLVKYEERDGKWNAEIVDSVERERIFDARNYYPLHRIDFDNPLLLASYAFNLTLNRIQFANYAMKRRYNGIDDENDGMEAEYQNYSTALSNYLAALRDLMGTDKDNFIVQLCAYKDMQSNFDSKMFPLYLATFTHPFIHQKAEQFYNKQIAQTDIASPLPVTPMADLIRSLCAKYPGKILMIDFWGMSCGPCRGAIQASKELRAEIAKRDDVKLVFIAGERTTEGSDEYKKYVSEWLADEETICVTKSDFVRLQELFQFNSIPHYETITPDCRRVRDDLRINGYDNFDEELQRLKEKLK